MRPAGSIAPAPANRAPWHAPRKTGCMMRNDPFAEVTAPVTHVVGAVGELTLEARLGHGRCLETFVGFHTLFGRARRVVIKRLRPELADNAALERALMQWATRTRAVEHPYLVRVEAAELGAIGAVVITEHVDGPSLAQLVTTLRRRRRAWTPAMALAVIEPVARALAHLHLRKYAHGALDADEVLIRADGVVKVSDAGLCAVAQQAAVDLLDDGVQRAEQGTAAGDVCALGLMLLELLLGHAPWQTGRMSIADAIAAVRDFTTFGQADPALALRLTTLLEGCLARDPLRRISAAEVVAAIAHAVDAHDFDLDPAALAAFLASAHAAASDESEHPTRLLDPAQVDEARRRALAARAQQLRPMTTSPGSRITVLPAAGAVPRRGS